MATVTVPENLNQIFQKAEEYVGELFRGRVDDPTKGTIEISGERYIMVRAGALSVDFFKSVEDLFKKQGVSESQQIARQILFDVAYSLGRGDAKNFRKLSGFTDPIKMLSIGPVHFSHSGWAFVDIHKESNPSPDENYYLIYDHPYSFESDAWIKEKITTDFPVCIMNAGYSSGWCSESFGLPLVASEITCRAKGDANCRFIMAQPTKIEEFIRNYFKSTPSLKPATRKFEIPGFFKTKILEEERIKHLKELEKLNRLMIERELKMIELKDEIAKLKGNKSPS